MTERQSIRKLTTDKRFLDRVIRLQEINGIRLAGKNGEHGLALVDEEFRAALFQNKVKGGPEATPDTALEFLRSYYAYLEKQ